MFKYRLAALVGCALFCSMSWAGSLSGSVKGEGGNTLPSARVSIEGTTLVTFTNIDGKYNFKVVPEGTYRVRAAFSGFESHTAEVTVSGATTQDFTLETSAISQEITVTANRAVIRETPVAFSNVSKEEIRKKYTTQDTPELLKAVPGVFSRTSGLGESDLYVRGFDSERVQIMINNVPVNDPESQVVYWSNWTGLSGNAADIQVQRGVGSSLYGSGAFGGSVNIETDNFSVEPYMSFATSYAQMGSSNDHYVGAFEYSSGFFGNDKMNFYFRYERKDGDSYIDGTNYDGHSFYFGFLYQPNDTHSLTINFHGAPQKHNQAANVQDPVLLERFGRTWNRRNHPFQENYFFKPVFEVHHDWLISSSSTLTSTFFLTSGDGGGRYLRNDHVNDVTGEIEPLFSQSFNATTNYSTNSIFNSSWKNDSVNKHVQFGANTSYKNVINEQFTVVTGGEIRFWEAEHYADSENFFYGANDIVDTVERRYDYDGESDNFSVYARLLWNPLENVTVMLDGQMAFYEQRVDENPIRQYDFFNRAWTDIYARSTLDRISNWDASNGVATADVTANPSAVLENYERSYDFFQPKFGVNWNINDNWSTFVNYSQAKKEPKVGDWYNRSNPPLSEGELGEESLTDLELGFSYRSRNQAFSVNFYSMEFEDKIESITDSNGDRLTLNAGNADHEGVEIAYNLAFAEAWQFTSSWSFSDNKWVSPSEGVTFIFGTPVEDIIGKHVPGAPQFIAFNEISYNKGNWSAWLNHSYWDDYYIFFDNSTVEGLEPDGTLPEFDETNIGVGYLFELANDQRLSLSFRVNNLFDNEHYVDGSYGRDFGRGGGRFLGVTQAAKAHSYFSLRYQF